MKNQLLLTLLLLSASALAQTSNGLVGYYPFNGDAKDYSGYGNHGILEGNNSVPKLTTDRHNTPNSAYEFSGYYDPVWIRIPNSTSLQFTHAMSFSVWLTVPEVGGMDGWGRYKTDNAGFTVIAKGGDGNATPPGLYMNATVGTEVEGMYIGGNNANGNAHDHSTHNFDFEAHIHNYVLGNWVNITFTVNDQVMRFYVDGSLRQEADMNGANFTKMNGQDLMIGIMDGWGPYWYPFHGKIDEVRIYNRALGADEVRDLYDGTDPEDIFIEKLEFEQHEKSLKVGESMTLTPIITPTDATNQSLRWISMDPTVLSVKDGVVTALKEGSTLISAMTRDGSRITANTLIKSVEERPISDELASLYAIRGFKQIDREKKLKGVTADGKAKLFIDCIAPDKTQDGVSPKLEAVGYDGTPLNLSTSELGSIEPVKYNALFGRKGFVYQAPVDFAEGYYQERYYKVIVSYPVSEGTATTYRKLTEIEIHRPGLLLVHGLNSNSLAFEGEHNYLWNHKYYCFHKQVDYQDYNLDSFFNNTYTNHVLIDYCNALFDDIMAARILSCSYDFVGHSMGGILSRLYVQNLNHDGAHKIITVNTPHWGSGIADYGGVMKNVAGYLGEKYEGAAFWDKVFELIYMIGPAVESLRSDSKEMKWLNDGCDQLIGVPVHAICSIITDDGTPDYNYTNMEHWYDRTYAFVADFMIDAIFDSEQYLLKEIIFRGDDHDGIVELRSQCTGLTGHHATIEEDTFRGKMGFESNSHHVNTTDWERTKANIQARLEAKVKSDWFTTQGFLKSPYAEMSHYRSPSVGGQLHEPESAATYLHMTQQTDMMGDTVMVDIDVETSPDIVKSLVLAFLDENRGFADRNQSHYRFAIPRDYSGDITFIALGRSSTYELVADTVTIHVDPMNTIDHIAIMASQTELQLSQHYRFSTKAFWEDETESYVVPEFSSSDESVISVSDRRIKAVGEGMATLTARYKGHIATLNLTVVDRGEVEGITEVNVSASFRVKAIGQTLYIQTEDALAHELKVTVYSAAGALIGSLPVRTRGSVTPVPLTLPGQGIYIVQIVSEGQKEVARILY